MGRRLLRIATSDDEEDGESAAGTRPASSPDIPPTNPNPSPTTPINISDEDQEDFVTVPDDLSNPSPSANSTPSPPAPSTYHAQSINSNPRIVDIDQFLRGLGLCIRHEWLEACSDRIAGMMQGYNELDVGTKAKKIFQEFFFADLNDCGAGVLPENVGMMHKAELEGPLVLQVDEMVNISAPIKERYQNAPAGPKRCLKLSMTDGVQRVFGIEYRPIKELDVLAPSGFKVVVRNVQVRRGLLMLVPEIMSFLGGMVEGLDQARQRLVSDVNKPPRGKRKQGEIPLSRRASLAAWSANTDTSLTNDNMQSNTTFNPVRPARPTHSPATASGITVDARNTIPNIRPSQLQETTMEDVNNSREEQLSFNQSRDSQQMYTGGPHVSGASSINYSHETSFMNEEPSTNEIGDAEQLWSGGNPRVIGESPSSLNEEPSPTDRRRDPVRLCGEGPHNIGGRSNVIEENDMVVDEEPSPVNNRRGLEQMECRDLHVSDNGMATRESDMADDDDTMMDLVDDGTRDDKLEMKYSPFTYMSSLQAQWEAEESQTKPSITGRIKCFLTGVKGKFGFQGKFDLQAYIDDGSLISLVKIDHNVIQKVVGHTPDEVVAALKSSDKKTEADMRQTMRNFQDFLRQFEGTMVLEINESSDLPIAIEMNQGSSSNDASLLLRRLEAMGQ